MESCRATDADTAAAADILSSAGDLSSTATHAHARPLPTRLTDTSLAQLPPSPAYTPAHSSSRRVRHSASDAAGGHLLLSTPSSYRASFTMLQPVDMPDVDVRRQRAGVVTRAAVSDNHTRSSSISCTLFTFSRRSSRLVLQSTPGAWPAMVVY